MTRALENLNGNQEKFGDSDWLKENMQSLIGISSICQTQKVVLRGNSTFFCFFQIGGNILSCPDPL